MRLLDRTALIEAPTTTRDAYGATIPGWATVATVRAALDPIKGSESERYGAQVTAHQHRITIRYRAGIAASQRVTIEGTAYDVRAVLEVGRHKALQLLCEVIA